MDVDVVVWFVDAPGSQAQHANDATTTTIATSINRRHSTLQLVQSFSLEEAEPNNLHGGDDDDEDSNAIRLILDGGTRGPTTTNSGTLQQRLDLSFCPAIDLNPLPAGDPARPRPARLRTAPVEVRIYDLRTEEYLDEAGLDRRQACGALLRFLAAVGDGGGWRA